MKLFIKKRIKIYSLGLITLFLSCSKDKIDSKEMYAYMVPGNSAYNILSNGGFTIVKSSIVRGANAAFPISISRPLNTDVEIIASIDSSLIKKYDSVYKPPTASPLLPAGAFTLANNGKVIVKAGESRSSDSIAIVILDASKIKVKTNYTIPIVISKVNNNIAVSSTRQIMYALVSVDSTFIGITSLNNTNIVDVPIQNMLGVWSTSPINLRAMVSRSFNRGTTVMVKNDNSLVSTYNTLNKTNYLALPNGSFTISKSTATIPANATTSIDSLTIPSPNLSALTPENQYLLPISIVDDNNNPTIEPTKSEVYIHYYFSNIDPSNSGLIGNTMSRTNWSVKASSIYSDSYKAAKAIDGSATLADSWISGAIPSYLDLNMGSIKTVKGFNVTPIPNTSYIFLTMEIYSSNDASNWNIEGIYSSTSTSTTAKVVKFITPVTAQYFRFKIITANNSSITGISELNGVQ